MYDQKSLSRNDDVKNKQKWSSKETKTNADIKKYAMSRNYLPPPKRT